MASAKHATMTVLEDRSVLVSGDKPNNDTYKVVLPVDRPGVTAIRVEVLPHESLPESGPGRAPLFSVGNFFLSEVEAALASAPDGSFVRPIAIRDASQARLRGEGQVGLGHPGRQDPTSAGSIAGKVGQPHAIVFRLKEPRSRPHRARGSS